MPVSGDDLRRAADECIGNFLKQNIMGDDPAAALSTKGGANA